MGKKDGEEKEERQLEGRGREAERGREIEKEREARQWEGQGRK